MSLIVIPNFFTVGATIVASQHNSNFSVIYSDYNGNVDNTNLSASAAIADTKLAQITTAGKLSGAAFTVLGSIPSGAGTIPAKNGGTGGDLSAATIGALPYFSATAVMSALGAGTSGQVLVSGGAGAPSFANAISSFLDYGTSASASTARQWTALKGAKGQFAFGANGSQAITSLPFTSSTSFAVVISDGYSVATNENIRVTYDSASQFTLYNDINRACTVGWIAIGT